MKQQPWWQTAVFYQIYPRSFADGNGDGIGDLRGMIDRLDYLRDLGVGAVWLSPHYPSPLFDCGYDIADYTAVAPEYGSMADFREFLDGAHARGIRVVLDLVLNHTSDQHPWFLESRSSMDHPKRDWYIWRDGKNGGPPNNWYSTFGGPAWELDTTTGQYYYHFFFKQQPDLNWRNPQVKEAMFNAARFWLDMGVDGFRLDAIGTIFEDPALPDQKASVTQAELFRMDHRARTEAEKERVQTEWNRMFNAQCEQPGMHELLQDLRRMVNEYPDRVLIGETDDLSYLGDGSNELHMVFNFPLMRTNRLTARWIRENQRDQLTRLPAAAWQCNTLGNHDTPRVYSQFGDGIHDEALARLSLALMLTLKGTPVLYNGEEIGMRNLKLKQLDQFRDMAGLWVYHLASQVLDMPEDEAFAAALERTRDQCRTPFQWSGEANGGFCPAGVAPWLPVHPNHTDGTNLAGQLKDPDSLFHFYQRFIHLRQTTPALLRGGYTPTFEEDDDVFSFVRSDPESGQAVWAALNFSKHARVLPLPKNFLKAKVIFSSCGTGGDVIGKASLAPFEILLLEKVE